MLFLEAVETSEEVLGMSGIVSALTNSTTGLTADKFFTVITDLVPFIVTMVPVALGLYFLRRLVSGAGKAKVKF